MLNSSFFSLRDASCYKKILQEKRNREGSQEIMIKQCPEELARRFELVHVEGSRSIVVSRALSAHTSVLQRLFYITDSPHFSFSSYVLWKHDWKATCLCTTRGLDFIISTGPAVVRGYSWPSGGGAAGVCQRWRPLWGIGKEACSRSLSAHGLDHWLPDFSICS